MFRLDRFLLTGVAVVAVVAAIFLIPAGDRYQDRIATAGHGMLFGPEGSLVELSEDDAFALHAALYRDAMTAPLAHEIPELIEGISLGDTLLDDPELTEDDAIYLRALQARMQAEMLSAELQSALGWRNDALLRSYMLAKDYQPKDEYAEMRRFLEEYWSRRVVLPYEDACAANGVPVPPKFGAASGVWVKQGRPAHNILAPGRWLEVWTWTDPAKRGACVALSRSLPNDDLAATGIICQGAKTGQSCFWDSVDPADGRLVYWDQRARDLTDIADGYQLQTCMDCHEGNDAYLVAPDDPIWCPLMRGGQSAAKPGSRCAAMQGNTNGNFTLQVEGLVNTVVEPTATTLHIHARHQPLGGHPLTPWANNAQPGCGGACHVEPSAAVTQSMRTNLPTMPPKCHLGCTLP